MKPSQQKETDTKQPKQKAKDTKQPKKKAKAKGPKAAASQQDLPEAQGTFHDQTI